MDQIARDNLRRNYPFGTHGHLLAESVCGVATTLEQLSETLRKAADLADFNKRRAALEAAAEFVNSQPAQRPNEKGCRDGVLAGEKLVTEQLRVARYLLGEGNG